MIKKIGHNWPLMPMTLPKKHTLQNQVTINLQLEKPRRFPLRNEIIRLEADTPWEKGMFIDIYV